MSERIALPESDEDLLLECRVDTFRSSGKGGQHVNVTNSAVRLTHLPTGLAVTCQEARSQYMNKRACLQKLRDKVEKLNYRAPKRVPTKISKGVKRANLAKKAKHSEKKRLRRAPHRDE